MPLPTARFTPSAPITPAPSTASASNANSPFPSSSSPPWRRSSCKARRAPASRNPNWWDKPPACPSERSSDSFKLHSISQWSRRMPPAFGYRLSVLSVHGADRVAGGPHPPQPHGQHQVVGIVVLGLARRQDPHQLLHQQRGNAQILIVRLLHGEPNEPVRVLPKPQVHAQCFDAAQRPAQRKGNGSGLPTIERVQVRHHGSCDVVPIRALDANRSDPGPRCRL